MVETALIIIIIATVIAFLNMGLILMFEDWTPVGIGVHILCAIASFVGVIMFIWGLLVHFKVIT